MGQWGETKKENGAKFILHFKTVGYEPTRDDSIIDTICFLDAFSDSKMEEIKEKYIGKKHEETI